MAAGPLDPGMLGSLRNLASGSDDAATRISDVISTFLKESEARVQQLKAAADDRDAEGLQGLAHRLAGSSASLGARKVAEVCRTIEALALAGDLDEIPVLLQRVDVAFAAAESALRAEFVDGAS